MKINKSVIEGRTDVAKKRCDTRYKMGEEMDQEERNKV